VTEQTKAKDLAREEREMDKEIERLEAEARELEAPARAFTWDEIRAGATEDLERRERRRGILPRLLTAAKVKRLEIRRERYEREGEPLHKSRDEAYEKLEAARTKRLEAIEEENAARYEYSDAFQRTQGHEKRMKAIDREIRELRGEEQTRSSPSAFEWAR